MLRHYFFTAPCKKQWVTETLPPLAPYVCALITGILCALWIPFSTLAILTGAMIIGLGHQIPYKLIALFLVGLGGAGSHTYHKTIHQQFIAHIDGHPLAIQGTIYDIETLEHAYLKKRITIGLHAIQHHGQQAWEPVHKTVHIYAQHWQTGYVGDTIEIDKVIYKHPTNENFNLYLEKEGIAATACIQNPTVTCIEHPQFSMHRYIWNIRHTLLANIINKLSPAAAALCASVFFGNKTVHKKNMEPIKHAFRWWGALHMLARSGLHLIIFIMVWTLILRVIPLPFIIKQGCIIILCLLYFILSWSSISFIRALFTACLYSIHALMRQSVHVLHVLLLATFCILAYNPLQLFFLDFQLSFGLTLGLAWFNTIFSRKFKNT